MIRRIRVSAHAISAALAAFRAAIDRAEDDWSRSAIYVDRGDWWPRAASASGHPSRRHHKSRASGVAARVLRRRKKRLAASGAPSGGLAYRRV